MRALVIGSMNCMPTEYAMLLKKYCKEVIHYYDAARHDTLSNPTIKWGKMSKEKTKGIVLKKIFFSHYLYYILPRIFHYNLIAQLHRANLIILSGPAISLARLVKGSEKKIIALSYGSDISLFCNSSWPDMPAQRGVGVKRIITRHLGFLKAKFLKLQISGLRSCTHYSYFIAGIDPETDALIDQILVDSDHPIRLPRYSISLDILDSEEYTDQLPHLKGVYKILFPVRFCEDELLGNKGWRLLFDGLKKYKSVSERQFICICFKKGNYVEALAYAKEIGVDKFIEWHEVVSFNTLKQYYLSAHVVIEQLGSHWIAQGLFAMALGKPVIGRVATEKQREFFEESGLLAVNDAESFAEQLVNCESENFRKEIGDKSRAFVPMKATIEPEFMKWGIL